MVFSLDAINSVCLFVCNLSAVLLRQSHLSVRPSVTFLLFAHPNITDLLQGEHTEILTGIGEGYRKSGFGPTKALLSLKRGKVTIVIYIVIYFKKLGWEILDCPSQYVLSNLKRQ